MLSNSDIHSLHVDPAPALIRRLSLKEKKSRDTVADSPDRAEGAQVHCLVDQEEAIIVAFRAN
jgi:hypothetical protein